MKYSNSESNISGTCFAYFTILFSGNYVKRVSDLPSGSFPSACPEALAAERFYCFLFSLLSWDSCNCIMHPNAVFCAGKLIVLPDQRGREV